MTQYVPEPEPDDRDEYVPHEKGKDETGDIDRLGRPDIADGAAASYVEDLDPQPDDDDGAT